MDRTNRPIRAGPTGRQVPARLPITIPASPMIPDEGVSESTLSQAATGYRTTLLSQGVRLLCKIAGVVVLARLVSPAEHGLFAMGASLTLLLVLFRDFGTGAAAIQAPVLTEGQKTALWRLHAGLGIALTGLTLALAPAVARFYHEPRVGPLLAVMSAGFFLNGLNAWPRTLLHRELHFTALNRVETWGAVVGTAAMVAGGAAGAGAYSFVGFLLVSEALMLVAAWRLCRWRPTAPAAWRDLRGLGRTGLQLTGYNLLLYGVQQSDTLLLGKWFGAGPLGLYNRAGQLLIQPTTHLAAPFSQVLLATLSRLGPGSPSFARHLRDTANAIAHFTLPVAVVCLVRPDDMVRLVLGPHWTGAAPLLGWLAVSTLLSLLTVTIYPLCLASGHAKRLTQLTLLSLPVTLLGLWLGRDHGPAGLAAGLAGANLCLLLPRLGWAVHGTPMRLRDYADAFAGPLGVAAVLAGGLLAGGRWARDLDFLPRLAVTGLAGAAAFGLCVLAWPRVRRELGSLRHHLPFGRGPAARP